MILLPLFYLSRRELLVPLVVEFYVFCIHLRCNNRILNRIAYPSQYMCYVSITNLYIGKCYYSRIHLLIFLYCVPCFLLYETNTMSKQFAPFESHLGLIIESHLGLMMDLRWVPQMAPLIVPMMSNLWVHCLVFQLDSTVPES